MWEESEGSSESVSKQEAWFSSWEKAVLDSASSCPDAAEAPARGQAIFSGHPQKLKVGSLLCVGQFSLPVAEPCDHQESSSHTKLLHSWKGWSQSHTSRSSPEWLKRGRSSSVSSSRRSAGEPSWPDVEVLMYQDRSSEMWTARNLKLETCSTVHN